MLFACNFSKELLNLLDEEPNSCDLIKIGAFGETKEYLDLAFSYKPLIIHGFGWFERGGMISTDVMDFDLMNLLLHKYQTPFLGMHAIAYKEDVIVVDHLLHHMSDIFKEISRKISVSLIIENMDSTEAYDYETTVTETVKPEFISDLIRETKLNLLLDTSHALVSSYQLNIDIFEYLERLPLEQIKEIHFTGSFFTKQDGYKDIHGIMNKIDYEIAEFLAKHPRIINAKNLEIITLEYGGLSGTNQKAIKEQLNKLKNIFNTMS